MAEPSRAESQAHPPPAPPNELLLARRLAQVTQERDDLAAELAQLKAERASEPPVRSRSPVEPPTSSASSAPSTLLTIPPEILPTLSLLRNHIASLTRDNDALRYTFLGTTSAGPSAGSAAREEAQSHGVNLEDVLKRVKELVKENEELGEMVLEAGRTRLEDWQSALDDSKAVITSLDADLEHHLAVIRSLQAELDRYKVHFGPLPVDASSSPGQTESRSSDKSERQRRKPQVGASGKGALGQEGPGGGAERADWDRDRDKDKTRESRSEGSRGKGRGRGGRPSRGGVASARGGVKLAANGPRPDHPQGFDGM